MKKRSMKAIAMIAAFCVAFTSIPLLMGNLDSSAMAKKKKAKVAKNVTVSAYASGQTQAVIKWNKIKKPDKGYAVFRNGAVIAHMGKKYAFTDSGLKAGTAYTYQIRTYKTKKVKQWYNKATGKWQKKKPKKKWRGKSRKVTTYTYKKKSNVVTVRTAPLNKYTITWKNWDGTILQSSTVLQGSKPSYSGSTPTRAADDDYIYTFKGWSPAVSAATGNKVYTAQYTAKENILPAPKGISYAVKSASGYIKITWNAVSKAEAYAIIYDGKVKQESSTTFFFTPFTEGENYTFQVAAIKNGKIQTKSKEFTITANSGATGTVEDTATPATPSTPSTPTAVTKQVTDYKGVTRTITKDVDSDGTPYWIDKQSNACMLDKDLAKWDKTVDGTFDGFTQKNGVTWKVAPSSEDYYGSIFGNWSPYVVMYNGDMNKLTFEITGLKTVSTHESPDVLQIQDRTISVVEKNGKRLAKCLGTFEEAYYADKKASVKYLCFEDRETNSQAVTQGLGFTTGTVTVGVFYNGQQIGKWTHTCNANANSEGLSPYRQECLEVARTCLESAKNNGDATGTLDADLTAIGKWMKENYTYEQLSCLGGRDVLETWSIYQYGKYGFSYKSNPDKSTHAAFCLDDLSNYWSAQGRN